MNALTKATCEDFVVCVCCGCLSSAPFPSSGLVLFILMFIKQVAHQNIISLPLTQVCYPNHIIPVTILIFLKRWACDPNWANHRPPLGFSELDQLEKSLS